MKEGILEYLEQLRNKQETRGMQTARLKPRIDSYLSALERNDFDFYYKYHIPGSHKVFQEEII